MENTREYQDQAVSLVLHSGRTIRDVAKSIGVHEITLGKWVTKAQGDESGRDKELSETERAELERLRKENAVLLWSMVGENGPVVVVRADAHEPNSGAWADRFFLAEVFCAPIELD